MIASLSPLSYILFGCVLGWTGAALFSRPGGALRVVISVATIVVGAAFIFLFFGGVATGLELIGTSVGWAGHTMLFVSLKSTSPKSTQKQQ